MFTSPDEVARMYAPKDPKLTIRVLDDEHLLIEGSSEALRMLGELLAAVAASEDCGFQISPSGPGSALFSEEATMGVYLHRTPCTHDNIDSSAKR